MSLSSVVETKSEQKWKAAYPKHVERNIAIPSMSVYDLLQATSKKKFNSPAIDFLGKKYTYGGLLKDVDNASAFLKNSGIDKGSKVALMVPNSPIYAIMFFAIARLGATIIQMNPLYTPEEIRNEMLDAQSKLIITSPEFYWKILAIDPIVFSKVIICKLEDFLPSLKGKLYGLTATRRRVPEEMKTDDRVQIFHPRMSYGAPPEIAVIDADNDILLIQYTGGTTGIPKGAMLTHKNLVANAFQLKEWIPPDIREKGAYLAAIPFFHVYGMMTALLLPVFMGQNIIMVPDPRNLNAVIKSLKKGSDIVFPGIPTMYHAILNSGKLKATNASNISMLLSGAAPLPMELEKEFTSITHGTIIEGYGLTEASPVVSATPIGSSERKAGTVGFPLSNTEIRFVDRWNRETFSV
jgi:Acyl-CoA synthetases (AMP-forming)/AMP-acid ligases II